MSHAFRDLLRKIGSGTHTSQHLSRAEAAQAMRMLLLQEATPAQIGAFLIAHRIKRPTGEELAGMLDACDELGPSLDPIYSDVPVVVLGVPYDGRSRTAPISPLTALTLAAAGIPTLQHGGDRMPTKEGLPLIDVWRSLGIDWTTLELWQVQDALQTTGVGFVYQPRHFPLAYQLVPYREQIGKRPPLATLELMWSPYRGHAHMVSGFVHPPTETLIVDACRLRRTTLFTTVKGLEGSCDLPRDRAAILGVNAVDERSELTRERLILHARDYGLGGCEPTLAEFLQAPDLAQIALAGESSLLLPSLRWNAGFYLWRLGQGATLAEGIAIATQLLEEGKVLAKLLEVKRVVASYQLTPQLH